MDEKLKNEWIDMIIDEESDFTTEELYSLINPVNKKEYFDLVDLIISRHSLKENDSVKEDIIIFTQEYRRRFKITAIKYFIELKKDKAKDDTISIPTIPINPIYPTYPNTAPWIPEIVYCTTSTNIK